MTSLADSTAVLENYNLPQHQAALSILHGVLADPSCLCLKWLDLACGKGQIIAHLESNLGPAARSKIEFMGYDIENAHSKRAKKIAEGKGLRSSRFEVGPLHSFWSNGYASGPWGFITLTNTTHEISPMHLANIFARCIESLDVSGCLFIYDMERLPEPELGAVPWSSIEVQSILACLLEHMGSSAYTQEVNRWSHRSCSGWSAQIRKQYLGLPADFPARIPDAIGKTKDLIVSLLKKRLERAGEALQSLAEYPEETGGESEDKISLLYEYWAVSRSLGENP